MVPKPVLLLLLLILNASIVYSQCTISTGTPVINETFGAGQPTFASPLPDGVTNMEYLAYSCPNDGQYTITNYTSGCWGNGWITLTDHTGDPNGYFMLINASYAPSDFYLRTIDGLCPGTTYEFSSWVINMASAPGGILPDITFTIEQTDGTILGTYDTGPVPVVGTAKWTKYGLYFKTPADISSVVIRMHNNAPGGSGNDLAIDDIGFTPSGPPATVQFADTKSTTLNNLCYNKPIQLTSTIGSCYIQNTYQWQSSADGNTWTDINGETNSTYSLRVQNPGTIYYRLNVAESGNIGNINCRVNSNMLTVISKNAVIQNNFASICTGQSYKLSTGKSVNKTGVYIDTLTNTEGCDSLITNLNLTVNPAPFSTQNISICEGQSYLGYAKSGVYRDTIAEPGGCDSVHVINLTVKVKSYSTLNAAICTGQNYLGYTKSGTYADTLVAANGCDSIRTVNLTVNPVSKSMLTAVICQGQSYLGYAKTGIYIDTLRVANGCDSVRTINLTVNPVSKSMLTAVICQGQSYLGYTKTGTYIDTLRAANGCDSIRTVNLTVNPVSKSMLTAVICQGQTYLGYTKTGTYIDTLRAANSCDSVRTINLTVNPVSKSMLTAVICQGQSYLGYTKTGTYIDTLRAANGCDSIRTINLTVNLVSKSMLTAVICQGQTYLGYAKTGTYIDTLRAANSCDSIRTINLIVNPVAASNLTAAICQGQSYLGYSKTGTYVDTLRAANGCDSVRTIYLTVNSPKLSAINAAICQGQSYLGYTYSGTYSDTLMASNGCDSIRTVNLIVNSIKTSSISTTICQGENYSGHTASGVYIDTLISSAGCDSIRTLYLTTYNISKPNLGPDLHMCFGDTVTLNPGTYSSYIWQDKSTLPYYKAKLPGTYWVKVYSPDGCEAADTVIVYMTNCKPINIPNTFTPNNDGINDVWKIEQLDIYNDCTVQIFNRYGQVMYSGKSPYISWDGKVNGKEAPVGTYYYIINVPDIQEKFSGWLLLVR